MILSESGSTILFVSPEVNPAYAEVSRKPLKKRRRERPGFALADEMVVSHVAVEDRILTALSPAERDQLRILLAKIGE